MKHLPALSTLLLVVSLSAEANSVDIRPDARERIDELVLRPLRERGEFWQVFSRARLVVERPALELWTSAPATDNEGRSFLAFCVRQVDARNKTAPTVVTGCYYPGEDAAYLSVELMNTFVPVEQHPIWTMEIPKSSRANALCRVAD